MKKILCVFCSLLLVGLLMAQVGKSNHLVKSKNQQRKHRPVLSLTPETSLRSASAIKQVLDSVVEDSTKWFMTYDSKGNETSEIMYELQAGSVWEAFSKDLYTYDSNNNQITYEGYLWNSITSTWDMDIKEVRTFSAKNAIQVLTYYPDFTGTSWELNNKVNNTYDVNNNVTLELDSAWTGSSWIFAEKYANTYIYNGNGKPTSIVSTVWNGTSWVNESKTEITYNGNGTIAQSIDYLWSGTWDYDQKIVYVYDGNGNTQSFSHYQYFSGWELNDINSYTYDAAVSISEICWPIDQLEDFIFCNKKMLTHTAILYNSGIEVSNSTGILYYNPKSISKINNALAAQVRVVPNPVTDGLQITGIQGEASLSILDMSGSQLVTKDIVATEYVDLSSLAQGIYIAKITTAEGTIIKKFVKK